MNIDAHAQLKMRDYLTKLNASYIRFAKEEFKDSLIIFLLLIILYSLSLYLFNIKDYKGYFLISFAIAIFLLSSYPRIFISSWLRALSASKVMNKASTNKQELKKWQDKFIYNKEVSLYDLLFAVCYANLDEINYNSQKVNYIYFHNNIINRAKFTKKFMYESGVIANRSYFLSIGQQDLTANDLLIIYDLLEYLRISNDEFEILKKNFLNNSYYVSKKTLKHMYLMRIINQTEYEQRLMQVSVIFKTKLFYLIKMSAGMYLLLLLGFLVAYFKNRLMN